MIFRPFWILMVLSAYMPFEEFLLARLPVSDAVVFYGRYVSEITVYLMFAIVVVHKLFTRQRFKRTPVDIPLFLFVVVIGLTVVANKSSIFPSLVTVRAMLRYVTLFYTAANISITRRQYRLLISMLIFIGGLEVFVGVFQYLLGQGFASFFLPRATDLSIGGQTKSYIELTRGREAGSIFGTLGDTIFFGEFMVLMLILLVERFYQARSGVLKSILAVLGIIFLAAIGMSYSRASLLAGGLVLMFFLRVVYGWKKMILIGISMLMLLVVLVVSWPSGAVTSTSQDRLNEKGVVDNFMNIFSSRYIDMAQKQRLGSLIGVAPTVLVNRPILGYGPDEDATIDKLNSSQKSFLLKIWDRDGFKDVYWVAILTFYGLCGFILIVWMFWRVYRTALAAYAHPLNPTHRSAAMVLAVTVMITTFILFFTQSLDFRTYSFYFWLMAGVMFSQEPAPPRRKWKLAHKEVQ